MAGLHLSSIRSSFNISILFILLLFSFIMILVVLLAMVRGILGHHLPDAGKACQLPWNPH
jgi:hypothetical protein